MDKAAKSKQPGKSYLVVQEFRDKDNFDLVYKVDADVSELPEERLADLISKGLVKKEA
jgi:hypothetical protein